LVQAAALENMYVHSRCTYLWSGWGQML